MTEHDEAQPTPARETFADLMADYDRRGLLQVAEGASERAAAEATAKALHARQAFLREIGVPEEHVERLVAGDLRDTKALAAAKRYRAHGTERMLILAGPVGCGKTLAACWLMAQGTPDAYPRGTAWPADLHARLAYVGELEEICFHERKRAKALRECSLLVIDDLGVEAVDERGRAQWRSFLDQLFWARHAGKLRTVVTTNLAVDAFKDSYGARIADRVRSTGEFVIAGTADEASLRGRFTP